MRQYISLSILSFLLAFSASTYADSAGTLETVSNVELDRYLGTWHEIARYPNSFQEGCVDSMAEYSLRDDGRIDVLNTCRNVEDGELEKAKGVAEIVEPNTNAKLKVTFLPPWLRWTGIGRGDYWIIDLAGDYSYSVVSEPTRKYLWILSRTPEMDAEVYAGIIERLQSKGFDTNKLIPGQ